MDNFINTLISLFSDVSSDTIFTVLTTIGIFVLGIIIKYILDYFDKRKKLKFEFDFYKYATIGLIKPIKKQINNYKRITNSIKDPNIHHFLISNVGELNFSHNEYRLYYSCYNYLNVRRFSFKLSALMTIYQKINVVDKLIQQMNENFMRFKLDMNDMYSKHNVALGKISEFNSNLQKEAIRNNDYTSDEFYIDFSNIYNQRLREMPLANKLYDFSQKYPLDPRTYDLILAIGELKNISTSIKSQRDSIIQIFEGQINLLTEALSIIENRLTILDNQLISAQIISFLGRVVK